MITAAINILIYAVLTLVLGLYKPKWALFWMKNPDRLTVIVIASVLFMVAATLFGEGKRAEQPDMNQPTETIEVPSPQQKTTENLPRSTD